MVDGFPALFASSVAIASRSADANTSEKLFIVGIGDVMAQMQSSPKQGRGLEDDESREDGCEDEIDDLVQLLPYGIADGSVQRTKKLSGEDMQSFVKAQLHIMDSRDHQHGEGLSGLGART